MRYVTSVQYRNTHDSEFPGVCSSLVAHSKLPTLLPCKLFCSTISATLSPTFRFFAASDLLFSFPIASANDYTYTDFEWSWPNYNQHLQHTLFQAISRSSNTLYLENQTVCHLLADLYFDSESAFKSPEFAIVLSCMAKRPVLATCT
jgi:hypothetical protein